MMEQRQREAGYCILCGKEAVSFGSRTITAGWLCGECIEKMSPWFRLRQDITPEELRTHLEYRENNKARLSDFCPTARLWKNPTLYLDDVHRKFTVSDALTKYFPMENPDILDYAQILQCDVEIEEHRTELKQFSPGLGRVSYRPKRCHYRFHIRVRILVNHPFFHEMRFALNQRPIIVKGCNIDASVHGKVVKDRDYQSCVRMAKEMRDVLLKAREMVLTEQEFLAERADDGHGYADL